MQIYFHSHLCSYLLRVPILVKGTVLYTMYITQMYGNLYSFTKIF